MKSSESCQVKKRGKWRLSNDIPEVDNKVTNRWQHESFHQLQSFSCSLTIAIYPVSSNPVILNTLH
jgi:hypothetical protein